MTKEKVNEYVGMGDIKDGEELTPERIVAELIRLTRVAYRESYEYPKLTYMVLNEVLSKHYNEWVDCREDISKSYQEAISHKPCPLVSHCQSRTGPCFVMEPDDGCYYYRYFRDLIKRREGDKNE